MLQKQDCNETVIFLGAGFTHDLELPVMNNFGSSSDQVYAGISADYNKNKDATPILKKAGDIFKKFQEYALNASRFINIDKNNMEDIFCLADTIKGTSSGFDTIPQVDNLTIDEIITNIQLWLWKIFQQCPPINNARLKAQKHKDKYEDFFRFLIEKHNSQKKISIITTNYDLMTEFFINEVGSECTYNIHTECNEWKAHPDSTNKFVHINNNNFIPIYKLHGSVNYFFGSNEDKNNINIVTDKLNVYQLGKSCDKVFKDRPSLFPLDAITELKKKNDGKIPTPAIIPPIYSKIESMEWLKNIWNNALMAIRNAKVIVFIGYSFPQSDGFMKSFFQSALVKREIPNAPTIINLDKDKDIWCYYCKIFGNIDSGNFLTGTFIDKNKDLVNIINSYSASI